MVKHSVSLALPYIRPISCRIAVANADLAKHRAFLHKAFTVAVAVIYCIGSLPNGSAGEEGKVRMVEDERLKMNPSSHFSI